VRATMFKRRYNHVYKDEFKPFHVNRETQFFRHPAAVQQTPTTLFADRPITPSRNYNWVIGNERRKVLFLLVFMLVITPLIFRYACGSSNNDAVPSNSIRWASNLDGWEWIILIVLWMTVLSLIFRLLPVITGGPSAVESSRGVKLDGVAALGLSSPFSSEDDTILLRSLLGRTCTVLHTCGGRHAIQGFYLDCVLNERRIKGEAQRRSLWLAWMKFLHAMVDVSLLIKEEGGVGFVAVPPKNVGKERAPAESKHRNKTEEVHYRPMYTQADLKKRGATQEPAQEPRSPPKHFKDVGTLVDSNHNVPEERRQRVVSWGKDPVATGPLSKGYASASPSNSSSGRRNSNMLDRIEEQDGDEEKDESEQRPSAAPVNSALESDEVDDDDIEMAAFRCSADPEIDAEARRQAEEVPAFSDKAQAQDRDKEGRDSGRRISPAINAYTRSTAGADRRGSHAFVLSGYQPPAERAPPSEDSFDARGPVSVSDFVITPNNKTRPLSQREQTISSAYLRPHSLPNLELNMSDLFPMIHLLDTWLSELRTHESGYDYFNPG
jgi:hypothetical protein